MDSETKKYIGVAQKCFGIAKEHAFFPAWCSLVLFLVALRIIPEWLTTLAFLVAAVLLVTIVVLTREACKNSPNLQQKHTEMLRLAAKNEGWIPFWVMVVLWLALLFLLQWVLTTIWILIGVLTLVIAANVLKQLRTSAAEQSQ